jgi:hypothetical protein
MNTPLLGVHESGRLVFMKPSVGGGNESKGSNATPKTTTAGPMGRQFRVVAASEISRDVTKSAVVRIGDRATTFPAFRRRCRQ